MLNAEQLRDLVIKPALLDLILYSEDAIDLLLFTCANESNGGSYLHQVKGPALGIYQMEPETYNDIWTNYIPNHRAVALPLLHSFDCARIPPEDRLVYDLRFATAMTRIFYARIAEPLPSGRDVSAMWDYYKKYYNTAEGAATKDKAVMAYYNFIRQ
jgi:hypothetical protein